jgi:aspartate aminotransferase
MIIVNSPHNPTGKIYPPETLERLAEILDAASERYGRRIYLLSDEAYSRIIFDGRSFYSPTAYYPHSLLIYTFGKTLLTPGQRIGYVALPPTMPLSERLVLREAIRIAQMAQSWAFPNALLQHALPELQKMSIDIEHLQEKRDRMVNALGDMGHAVHSPEATFYLLPRSPLADDWAFTEILAQHKILALPGEIVELPGYFRLSLTANADMIEAALPGFEAALMQAENG